MLNRFLELDFKVASESCGANEAQFLKQPYFELDILLRQPERGDARPYVQDKHS